MRQLLVVLPCRTYKWIGSAGGSVPYSAMLGMLAVGAVGGGIAWAAAPVVGASRDEGLTAGLIAGLFLCILWIVYSVLVVLIVRLRGQDPHQLAKQRHSS